MNLDSLSILRLILATLTCFRLAQLIALDNGPLYIFHRFRITIEQFIAKGDRHKSYLWRSVADGLSCPYCLGFYISLLSVLLLLFPTYGGDLFLLWFGIMGLQAFLQGLVDEGEPRK